MGVDETHIMNHDESNEALKNTSSLPGKDETKNKEDLEESFGEHGCGNLSFCQKESNQDLVCLCFVRTKGSRRGQE